MLFIFPNWSDFLSSEGESAFSIFSTKGIFFNIRYNRLASRLFRMETFSVVILVCPKVLSGKSVKLKKF